MIPIILPVLDKVDGVLVLLFLLLSYYCIKPVTNLYPVT